MDTRTRSSRSKRHRLGQHFLKTPGPAQRLVEAIAPQPGDLFLEVGPGRGGVTFPLLLAGAHVLAVEIDPVLVQRLQRASGEGSRLAVVEGDILKVDLPKLLGRHFPPGQRVRVVGNLPYSVASATLLKLLTLADHFSDLSVMVQREVADRILSPPGGRSYGVLTLLCSSRARAVRLLDLPPRCFSPPPKVHSTLLRLTPREPLFQSEEESRLFDHLVKAAFSARRKKIRNSLSGGLAREPREVEAWLEKAGIDPEARPESVTLQGYLTLARGVPAV